MADPKPNKPAFTFDEMDGADGVVWIVNGAKVDSPAAKAALNDPNSVVVAYFTPPNGQFSDRIEFTHPPGKDVFNPKAGDAQAKWDGYVASTGGGGQSQSQPQATSTPNPSATPSPQATTTPVPQQQGSGQTPSPPAATPPAASGATGGNDLKTEAANIAKSYGIPPDAFINLINHESGFNPNVPDNPESGAMGLGQILKSNLASFGIDANDPSAVAAFRADPEQQLRIAARMLQDAGKAYGGDYDKAFASYYMGGPLLQQAIAQGGADWLKAADTVLADYLAKNGYKPQQKVSEYVGAIRGGGQGNYADTGINNQIKGGPGTATGAVAPTQQQQSTPPPLPPSPVGTAPSKAFPGFTSALGQKSGFPDNEVTDKGIPIYQGNQARQAGLPTLASSTPGSVSIVSPQGGWGYNPFAIKAGEAGLTPTAPNAAGLAAFNIPFGGQPNERTGNFSPSQSATQFTSNYLDNPYSANNPIEQAQLAGVLVKPTPNVGNAYGGQALTSEQPYKRGGFIHTPPIQQADSMPPADFQGNPRMYSGGGEMQVAGNAGQMIPHMASGGGLTIPEPARVIGQSGRVYATVGEVRPEELNPKPGGFSIVNHVPGTERYAQAGANRMPGVPHADFGDSFFADPGISPSPTPAPAPSPAPTPSSSYSGGTGGSFSFGDNGATGYTAPPPPAPTQPAPTPQPTPTPQPAPTPTPGGLSSAPLPITPITTPAPGTPAPAPQTNSISSLLNVPTVGNLGASPQPPSQLMDQYGMPQSGTDSRTGLPTQAALSDSAYQQQLAAYNSNLDRQDADLQSAAARSQTDLLNRLGSPEAEAEKLANANLQHQRDSTDYKYGLAGMHTPVEVQPPYAFPGSPLPSSMGLPPGQRYRIESPEEQYQTLLGFAQNYFNAARNQISAARAVSALNQPPAASLSSQLVNGISRATASATGGGGAGFQNSFSINRGISG